jgi:DNA invertase Pin-like site-specific DNA recombinase
MKRRSTAINASYRSDVELVGAGQQLTLTEGTVARDRRADLGILKATKPPSLPSQPRLRNRSPVGEVQDCHQADAAGPANDNCERSAFGYLRVSSESQIAGDGLPRQRAAIQAWAMANNVKIVRWFEERGVSGTIDLKNRPALSSLMVALLNDGVRLVVIEKLDRIARDQMIQESIIQTFLKQSFELVSAASGEENLCGNDPGRKLMRTIMGAIAEYDKQMIVLKLRAARERAKAVSPRRTCEGRKPYGFYSEEAAVLQRIVQLQREGKTHTQISRLLNDSGQASRSNGQWFAATVRFIGRLSPRAEKCSCRVFIPFETSIRKCLALGNAGGAGEGTPCTERNRPSARSGKIFFYGTRGTGRRTKKSYA